MIKINYDFTDGTEVSYIEGLALGDNFTTNCLDFFSFDTAAENVRVVKKDGGYIDRNELMTDIYYTNKDIRVSHNIHKMLKANQFKFKY